MANGVDPGVEPVQPSGPEPAPNRTRPKPDPFKLPPAHNPVLTSRQLGDPAV